ncbi:MAG: cholesterol oxidase substrate-binding domain-containing protein [Stellaceae bacterium]
MEAQKIACINNAGFDMSFVAQTNGARSISTDNYPINQTRVIDLATTPFREGMEFWPVVDAVLGRTQAAGEHIVFKLNGQTATYAVTGTTLNFDIKLVGSPDGPTILPDWPTGIPLDRYPFKNWAGDLVVPNLWTCAPRTAADVVAVCNWARDHGFRVRPRGFMHTWSPLTVTAGIDPDHLLLVDLTKSLFQAAMIPPSGGRPPCVRVATGATMGDLLQFLETQPGGRGSAPGYSFPHTPAPGNLTVGGVLAINAHGTAVPTPPLDNMPSGYGSMSNRILEFTAVVTDPHSATPDRYTLRTFQRGEGDDKAFLAHVGRAFLTEVVLEVVDNYNLRCRSYTDLPVATIFPPGNPSAAPPANSFGDFLNRCGRVEVIWFPFTDNPWLHIWEVAPQKPAASREVRGPFNYPFADDLDPLLQSFLKAAFSGGGILGSLTPELGSMAYQATAKGLDGKNLLGSDVYPPSHDIWGPSKNTLLYVQDTTLKVTANGYAVQMRKRDVQQAVHDFANQVTGMLAQYRSRSQYPVNSAIEIRVTGLDDPADIAAPAGKTAQSPVISSLTRDPVAAQNQWDVALWLDVLTIPGTPNANQFYQELEEWLSRRFAGSAARVLPEWSKGWAYTNAGAWTNQGYISAVRQLLTAGRAADDNWHWEVATLQKYDSHRLFFDPFLEGLFGGG